MGIVSDPLILLDSPQDDARENTVGGEGVDVKPQEANCEIQVAAAGSECLPR